MLVKGPTPMILTSWVLGVAYVTCFISLSKTKVKNKDVKVSGSNSRASRIYVKERDNSEVAKLGVGVGGHVAFKDWFEMIEDRLQGSERAINLPIPFTFYLFPSVSSSQWCGQYAATSTLSVSGSRSMHCSVFRGFLLDKDRRKTGICTALRKYLRAVLRQDDQFFDTRGTHIAEVFNTVYNDTLVIQDALGEKVPNFIINLSTFIATYAVSFYLSWRMASVTMPLASVLIAAGMLYGRTLIRIARKMHSEYNESNIIAEQTISAIITVYSFVGEEKAITKFSSSLVGTVKLGLKQGLAKGLSIGGNRSVVFCVVGIRVLVWKPIGNKSCSKRRKNRQCRILHYSRWTVRHIRSLASALSNVKYLSEAGVAAFRIFEMIEKVPEIDSEDVRGKVLEMVSGEVQFRNVEFAYPSRPESIIFNKFCLTIPARQTVALVGASGSGKSTAIALLERFYDPIGGEILLDGENIKSLQLKWLRSQLGLVNQEPALFAASIRENMIFGKGDARLDEIISVVKDANAHTFITQLPKGYDRQRIAIARALLKNPSILLLDEATSALDAESEKSVQDALGIASIGRTTLIVAHRLSTIQGADKIAVMKDGEVIEFGGHQELILKPNGTYAALVQIQDKTPAEETIDLNTLSGISSQRQSSDGKLCASNRFEGCISGLEREEQKVNAETKSGRSPSFRRLLALNAPEWKNAFLGCGGAFGYAAIQIAFSFTMARMTSALFLKNPEEIRSSVRISCIVFTTLALLAFLRNLVQHYNLSVVGEFLTSRVPQRMFSKILTFEVGWFDQGQNSTAAVCSRLAKEANVVRSLVGDRVSLLVECLSGVIIAASLGLVVAWQFAVVLIAVQPLMVVCFYIRRVLLQGVSRKSIKAEDEGNQIALECVTHHRTIAAFCSQGRTIQLFDSTQEGPRTEINKQSWYAGLALRASRFFEICYWPLEFWYGGKFISHGCISFHDFLLNHFVFTRMGGMIADAGSMTSDLAKGSDAVTSVFEILDRNSYINPDDHKETKPYKIQGTVEARNVDFVYLGRPNAMILRDFCLRIDAESSLALVGRSGSGKSTIIGLIERF
eukprot:PITA_14570